MGAPTARWMFADSGVWGSRRLARRNPLRWSSRKSLDAVCAELACCGPELRARPVRVQVSCGTDKSEELTFRGTQQAVLELRRRSQVPPPAAQTGGENGGERSPGERPSAPPAFRFEDRSKIPDELLVGPFEKFQIAEDVYSTAYLIARNATEDMYSFWPWVNPQVRIVWLYLLFIVGSQLFVITVITVFYPPTVESEVLYVDCANSTTLALLHARGVVEAPTSEQCRSEGRLAFWADFNGAPVAYHAVETATPFFEAVLSDGSGVVYVLRFICCSWVFSQMYFNHFANVRSLVAYHDFSRWFLPLKGMEARNNWAVGIAFVQYAVVLVVTTVSFVIICAQRDPSDIVMNSLAFTFVAEVGTYFNGPLVRRMAETKIDGLPKDYGEIFYLYPEYLESNAIREDGTYTDEGWYVLEEEEKAGLLSDYQVKHNPAAYSHPSDCVSSAMSWLLFLAPVLATLLMAIRARGMPGPLAQGAEVPAEL